MGVISANDMRKGVRVEIDGDIYEVVEFQHIKKARRAATVRVKLKNLINGRVIEKSFLSTETVNTPDLEERKAQFLYAEGDTYHFMDLETYEQYAIDREVLGDAVKFLIENLEVGVLFHEGKPVSINLPITVELEVVDTPPGVRGDTESGGSKPATLSTGAVVQVPLFINVGDIIKVDTRTGEYVERVSR